MKLSSLALISLVWLALHDTANALTCPAAQRVAAAWPQLDDAIPDDRTYIVTTSQPAFTENQHDWMIRTVVPARSQEDAVKLARITVKEASALLTPNAVPVLNKMGCVYFSARAFVYALTSAAP